MGQHRTNKPTRKQLRKRARRDAEVDARWAEFCRQNNIDPNENVEQSTTNEEQPDAQHPLP